ncbi:hypothetical protein TSAR_002510 [Trichomalopsis sarcophagae]|uniref:Uncharacterized protein n=1 Tax=Trichomalopsis sarcophagae TaxID=543379 RepID=A0A232F9U2_9HYME|nr:hypothetical protein TSAR_002510 [Trichomalopsis sarcophagae]
MVYHISQIFKVSSSGGGGSPPPAAAGANRRLGARGVVARPVDVVKVDHVETNVNRSRGGRGAEPATSRSSGMDTRAPPIASRTQERCQQHQQQQQQQQKKEEVTLPPLTSYPVQQRHKTKFAPTPSNWRNSAGQNPGLLGQQEVQRRRPYK